MPVFRKDGRSILFVHVPKTGGTSVERLFARAGYNTMYRAPGTGPSSGNWIRRCSPQHMHAAMLEQILDLRRLDVVFMLVREPIARFRSEYSMRNAQDLRTDKAAVEKWTSQALRAYAQNSFVHDNHLRPQSEFYLPGSNVYRLEDGLEAMVADLNDRFGLGLPQEVPRAKDRESKSGVASSQVTVSPSLERDLRTFYAEDFVRFGY